MDKNIPLFGQLLIPRLGRTSKCIGMLMNGRLAELDLSLKQFILLMHVKNEQRAQSDLVLITERNKGSLTRLIQAMERKGFIVRSGSEKDKRINYVNSTESGRKVLEKAEKIVLSTMAELTSDISKSEEETLNKTSSKLMEKAHQLMEADASK